MFPQFSYAVLLENLVFEGNIAKQGGAMGMDTIPLVHDSVHLIKNITFKENLAIDGNGGALYLDNIN